MKPHHKLDYVEFHSRDLGATKAFFQRAFGWEFTDYGEEYTAFSNEGLDGGFFKSDAISDGRAGFPMLIFYSAGLEESIKTVRKAGGKITREVFSFPGGRRFHFLEPGGNVFAIWSDVEVE